MTKMQIIAKAILVVLGIHAVTALCRHLTRILSFSHRGFYSFCPSSILFFTGLAVFFAVIILFLIFRNDWLACRIAGAGEQLNPAARTIWLVTSLRLGLSFCGLILLASSVWTIVKILLIPAHIRLFINEMFLYRSFPASFVCSFRRWCDVIYDFLKIIFAIYFLCGAPHFVRWQLRHSTAGGTSEGQKERALQSLI